MPQAPITYSAPTLGPSGASFGHFKAVGLSGLAGLVAAANSLPPSVSGQIRDAFALTGPSSPLARAATQVDNFLRGDPTPLADVVANLAVLASCYHAIAQAIDEAAALCGSNPGQILRVPTNPSNATDRYPPTARFFS